jgi:hypothetical protein
MCLAGMEGHRTLSYFIGWPVILRLTIRNEGDGGMRLRIGKCCVHDFLLLDGLVAEGWNKED